ncbi:hypothetical protein SH501x_001397 [Pirellulaceae bacterium SH501]
MANYKLSSAMSVKGKIHLAGTILPESEFSELDVGVMALLISDEHLVETEADPTPTAKQPKPMLLPTRRKQTAEPKTSDKPTE